MVNILSIVTLDHYCGPELVKLPRPGDVGIDLYSAEDKQILSNEVFLLKTGIKVEIPSGFWLNIRDRSSMSKHFHVLAGVIDSSYRGEIMVRMYCHTPNHYKIINISKGDKIAQMIICKDYNDEFLISHIVDGKLSTTDRGEGGFGSTGR